MGSLGSLVIFGNLPPGPKRGCSKEAPCNNLIFNSSEKVSCINLENNAAGFTEPIKSYSVVTFLEPLARTITSPRIVCNIPSSMKTARD